MLKRMTIVWKLGAAFVIIMLVTMVVLNYLDSLIVGRYVPGEGVAGGYAHFLVVLIVIVVISFGLAWLFVRLFLTRSVRRLADGMNRLANREFDFRLEEDERDEFGALSSSFNDMAEMLTSSLNELKKNRDYLESIFESSADIIITVNASGRIATINTGAENALGYRTLEVIGQPIEILFADSRDKDLAVDKLRYADNVINFETQFVTKSGKIRDVLFTLTRMRNPGGAVIGTIGIGKDVTEEKRLQRQLIQSQRLAAIGEVFTGIQHSMKNMLNACKGGAYMVRTGLAKENRVMLEEGWEMVQEGIDRMTDMSMDMLKYVKEWKPRINKVSLAEIVTQVYNVIKQTARDKGVDVRLAACPDLPAVMCDGRMIHSAVMDIVSNAVDACLWKDYRDNETPAVSLGAGASEDGTQAIIEISDNGCGMTTDVIQNIFTPFFSTKSKAGTGLGLSISSRMIDVHGGKIDVDSTPDVGTTFRIVLPINGTNRSKEYSHGKEGSGS